MKSFYLATSRGSANAGSDMLNPQFLTAPIKLCFSPGRLKLRPLIRKNLVWNTIPLNSPLKQQNGVFSGWTRAGELNNYFERIIDCVLQAALLTC
jgi:hypothetical protein